jgi:hypothetical protein
VFELLLRDLNKMFIVSRFWRFTFFLCLSCQLSGCIKPSSTLPQWVSSKPQDEQAYYATGQGVDLYDAEVNARSAMAAELSATVSDTTRVYMVSDGKYQRQIFEQFTTVEVSKIKLSQARVSRQQGVGNQYFVLLKMLKSDLAAQLKQDIKRDVRAVSLIVKHSSATSFEQWWKLRQVLPKIKRITRNMNLLEKIERIPTKGRRYSREAILVKTYFEQFDESYNDRELEIKNSTNIKSIYDLLSKQLQGENITLGTSRFWNKLAHIDVSTDYTYQKIGQEFYVDAILWLRLKSSSGQVLSAFSIEGHGVSYSSRKQSQAMADQTLFRTLKSIDVIASLIEP